MKHSTTATFHLKPLAASLLTLGFSTALLAAPQDGVLRAGSASISQSGNLTQVQQTSDRAIIDWRSFSVGALESVAFNQPSRFSATLNRVTGDQVSVILGKLTANGQVVLINPNGMLFGAGSQIDVGGLIASTANISNKNFMDKHLVFDQAGKPGASIVNQGSISAIDGGLVALVAPTVRNDGIIQARLGKIVLGAGDTFTLDLYGDQLINLALAPEQAAHIVQSGQIIADGGQVVLISAPQAKAVLDQVINMSGTIRADSIAEHEGKIVLSGSGEVVVSGQLSAQGKNAGEQGGSIAVLGDVVNLSGTSNLDASGAAGGGTIHVGGAWQGSGDTLRAQSTTLEQGARIAANATDVGHGGEVVVWSDHNTRYAGDISARGGAYGGDGGRIEVSGKHTLEFLGTADASAPRGKNGSLLLDPADVSIGLAEAALIARVLRTGTTVQTRATVVRNSAAGIQIDVCLAGGGLTLTAGNNLTINEFIVTNNGAINLNAGNTISVASGKAVFAGTAAISATSGGDLNTVPLISTGGVTYRSTGGSVFVNQVLDNSRGAFSINAAQDVNVNQLITNLSNGSALSITAGNDINVNAQIDGRNGVTGGIPTLLAGRDILLNSNIVTNAANINLNAGRTVTHNGGAGLYSGAGSINVTTGGNLSTGLYVTTGALNLSSTSGNVSVDTVQRLPAEITINAGNSAIINQAISTGKAVTIIVGAGGVQNPSNIDTGSADLTIRSSSDLSFGTFTTNSRNVIIDTRGALRGGTFNGRAKLLISADQGIGTVTRLNINNVLDIEAYSLNGNISIGGDMGALKIGTGFNASTCIFTPGSCALDPTHIPSQGGSVNVSGTPFRGGTIVAGGAITVSEAASLRLTSGASISANSVTGGATTFLATGNITLGGLNLNGPSSEAFSATSNSGNILINSGAILSNLGLNLTATTGSVTVAGPTIMNGTININAGQNITFSNAIGADYRTSFGSAIYPNGVANVLLTAGSTIDIQGARSSGNIAINAGGTFTSNNSSVFSTLPGTPVTINASKVPK